MKIKLARIITGKGRYAFQPLLFPSKKLRKIINIFSFKIQQGLQESILKLTTATLHNNIIYTRNILEEQNSQLVINTTQVTKNHQLYLSLDDQKHSKLAFDNTCTGWNSMHRTRGTQYTRSHAVKQKDRCYTILCKNQTLHSFSAWLVIFFQSHLA
jgi:hypothetical protein